MPTARSRPPRCASALQDHDDVALVSVMWANNEVGTIMPIAELAAVAAEFEVPMHTDAVQAVGQMPVDFAASGLSALSVAAHKFGGPIGVGALLLRRDTGCVPLLHGGGQERDVRSGTLDVAGAVGDGRRAKVAIEGLATNSARVQMLRDGWSTACCPRSTTCTSTAPPVTPGCPATRTSPSPAARATRC